MTGEQRDWTEGVPVLLVSRCAGCAHAWYLRRPACPRCGGSDVSREPSAGTGVVVASTTVHPAGHRTGAEPYGIALVDLDDGVRVMCRCPPDARPGLRVVADVRPEHVPGRPGSGPEPLVLHFQGAVP